MPGAGRPNDLALLDGFQVGEDRRDFIGIEDEFRHIRMADREALGQYSRALKVNPRDEHILFNLGRVHLDLKDYAQASQMFRKALDINPNFVEAQEMLKSIELGLGLKLISGPEFTGTP